MSSSEGYKIAEAWFDANEDSSDAGYSVCTHADLGDLARRIDAAFAARGSCCEYGAVNDSPHECKR